MFRIKTLYHWYFLLFICINKFCLWTLIYGTRFYALQTHSKSQALHECGTGEVGWGVVFFWVFVLFFLIPLLCSRFTASFVMLLKSWSTLRMSSLRVCSRELPGYLMTSTKDQDMVLMMHSSTQSRKDIFSTSWGLFYNCREVFTGIDPS